MMRIDRPGDSAMRPNHLAFAISIVLTITLSSAGLARAETCFGIPDVDVSVCGGHGVCVGNDICVCEVGYLAPECTLFNCFGIANDDVNVCSQHGTCIAPDTCLCEVGYIVPECAAEVAETPLLTSWGALAFSLLILATGAIVPRRRSG